MKAVTGFLFLMCAIGISQNTLQLKDGQVSPDANLEEISWITGHWRGEAFGGIAEEIWSPPLGNTMMFVFKLSNDADITFYEIGHIKQEGSTLLMQLKHFHGSLKGWEEKEDTVDFKLVKVEKNAIFFEGLTIEKINANHINFYVIVDDGEGKEEYVFNYKRFEG